jgi:peptidoglycan/xylan/chitin deacetylase (PgdA/CDA1 family)
MQRGLRRKGVVVAFHRVNDRTAGDALTRSSRDYERLCEFFRTHFDVVSLGSLRGELEAGRSLEGKLAVPHDDGYLDNYEFAAPILEKLNVPATFFVSSEFIGSETIPFWDQDVKEKLGWMSWDQVRDLRRRGFEIGAHTKNHVDLGAVEEEEARVELRDSRQHLESELGQVVDLFAYPFGGERHMNATSRALVRSLGYRCCLSSHGGVVPDGSDPFDLRRVPISMWYADPDQLAYELGLGRT